MMHLSIIFSFLRLNIFYFIFFVGSISLVFRLCFHWLYFSIFIFLVWVHHMPRHSVTAITHASESNWYVTDFRARFLILKNSPSLALHHFSLFYIILSLYIISLLLLCLSLISFFFQIQICNNVTC